MKILFVIVALLTLQGCAYYEGQRVLNDPDCSFIGKDINFRWPAKCGTLGGGTTVYVRQTGPNTYYISK
jgi:hypothetical protein